MTKAEFAKFLRRDQGRCYECGRQDDTLVPQHRRGRKMGGSKSASTNGPANIITFCSEANGRLERDADFKAHARIMGWSLESWQDPEFVPVYDVASDTWFILEADGSRHVALVD
jgi:hypothetical protein